MKIAFISDIHEDIKSLTRAMRLIEKSACDEIVCLGDIIGFSVPFYKYLNTRDANACIKLISENTKYTVAGNHEHFALRKIPMSTNGIDIPANWYELTFEERKQTTDNKVWLYEDNELSPLLNDFSKNWLLNLPEYTTIKIDEIRVLLSHYIFPDNTGFTKHFINTMTEFRNHLELMNKHNARLSVFGHAHPAGLYNVDSINNKFYITKKTKVCKSLYAVGIPAITSASAYQGFAVFDSGKGLFETIALNNRLRYFNK